MARLSECHRKKILALADVIEAQDHIHEVMSDLPRSRQDMSRFNMSSWQSPHSCGTAGCIAGWIIGSMTGVEAWSRHEIYFKASAAIGISLEKAERLFEPRYSDGRSLDLDKITPREAAATLRGLAETGEVRWVREEKLDELEA